MKKKNLLLGMMLAVGLGVAGCGTSNHSKSTRVEQENTQNSAAEGMQAEAPKTEGSEATKVEAEKTENATDQAASETNIDKKESKTTETKTKSTDGTTEITEQEAKEIALKDAQVAEADVKGIRVEKDIDDGRHQYEVDFYAGNKEYDYDIDLYTGEIISRDYDIENDFDYTQNLDTANYISKEEAIQIVLDRVKGATANQVIIELDEENGYLIYEGEVHYNNREYEFELNASDGKILEWSEESAID